MIVVCPQCMKKNSLPDDVPLAESQCGQCDRDLWSSKPISLNDETFMSFVPKTEVPVLVDFWAEWCGPCRAMAPRFEQLAAQYKTVQFAKVNTEEAPRLSEFFNIRSIPSLILFRQTTKVDTVAGAMSIPQLQAWLKQNGIGE